MQIMYIDLVITSFTLWKLNFPCVSLPMVDNTYFKGRCCFHEFIFVVVLKLVLMVIQAS